jgi:hypothetical protein
MQDCNTHSLHFFHQIGPGIVYMRWESKFGSGAFTHEVTPVEPLLQRLCQTNYGSCPNIMGKVMLYAEAVQVGIAVQILEYI